MDPALTAARSGPSVTDTASTIQATVSGTSTSDSENLYDGVPACRSSRAMATGVLTSRIARAIGRRSGPR